MNPIEFMDVGCNAGLTSFLAHEVGYDHVISLDHDKEYVAMLSEVLALEKLSTVEPHEFSFGQPFPQRVDVMFVGALIHWVFTCTADFGRFNKIMAYSMNGVSKILVIEWVDPQDHAIKNFRHTDGCGSGAVAQEAYTVANFERSLQQIGKISEKWHSEEDYPDHLYGDHRPAQGERGSGRGHDFPARAHGARSSSLNPAHPKPLALESEEKKKNIRTQ